MDDRRTGDRAFRNAIVRSRPRESRGRGRDAALGGPPEGQEVRRAELSGEEGGRVSFASRSQEKVGKWSRLMGGWRITTVRPEDGVEITIISGESHGASVRQRDGEVGKWVEELISSLGLRATRRSDLRSTEYRGRPPRAREIPHARALLPDSRRRGAAHPPGLEYRGDTVPARRG